MFADNATDMDEHNKGDVRRWAGLVLDSVWRDNGLNRDFKVSRSRVSTETIDGHESKQIEVTFELESGSVAIESASDMMTKVESGTYRPLTGCEDAMAFIEKDDN